MMYYYGSTELQVYEAIKHACRRSVVVISYVGCDFDILDIFLESKEQTLAFAFQVSDECLSHVATSSLIPRNL